MKKLLITFSLIAFIAVKLISQSTCETAIDFGDVNSIPKTGSIDSLGAYWFMLTTTSEYQNVNFSLCEGTEFDSKMEIWTDCDAIDYWKFNDDGILCPHFESAISVDLLPAGTYYIKIYGFDQRELGDFSLSITGTLISTCETAIDFGNINGPAQTGSIIRNGESWYSFTITENMDNILFSTCNEYTEFDTEMEIYGNCGDSIALWIGEDECIDYRSQIFVSQLSAGTYYIKISGYSASSYGNYSLTISTYEYDSNTCETAFDYGSVNAPAQSGSLIPRGMSWYSVTVDSDIYNVIFSLCEGTNFDTKMELWTSCSDNTFWKSNDDACGIISEIHIDTLPAGTYYVKVFGYDDSHYGHYSLLIAEAPVILESTIPDNNDIDIPIDASISAEFQYKILPQDLSNISISPDPGGVSAQINNNILSIDHDNFENNIVYTVNIPSGTIINDSEDIIFSFTTISDTISEASLNLATWDAGEIEVGNTGVSGNFTLTNTKDGILTVYAITELSSPWSSTFGDPADISLSAGQSHTFEFSFAPTDEGFAGKSFEITTNAGTERITLYGIGVKPELQTSLLSWDAENVPINETATSPEFKLKNIGTGTLLITNITELASPWETSFDPESVSLASGEEYTFTFSFIPTESGEKEIDFIINTNGGIDTIALSGKGINNISVPTYNTNTVNIYPNPSKGIINISVSENSMVKIFDITGKLLDTYNNVTNDSDLSLNLSAGTYYILVESNGNIFNHKVVIQ